MTGNDPWLTKCPNRHHFHGIGKLKIDWQIASDFWAAVEKGFRVRHLVNIAIIKKDETTCLRFIVMKLALWMAWL